MQHIERAEIMWGLGLDDAEHKHIKDALGPGFKLKNYPAGRAPLDALTPEEHPSATWIPRREWERIPMESREVFREMENTQRILIQDDNEVPLEMEQVIEEGFLTVIHSPLTRDKVQDALFRAKEVDSLYSEVYRMTEEIILERELLKRKTDQLLFLNRFLANATGSLDPAEILSKARKDLEMLTPVKLMSAAFWQTDPESGETTVELMLDAHLDHVAEGKWVEFLLDAVSRAGATPINGFHVVRIHGDGEPLPPESGRSVVMPLSGAQGQFGCLAMLCERGMRLAKDQVQTLKSAVMHLGLALNNARLYREVKIRADRDGLTKLHNRSLFDRRLVVELKRSQRYGTDLSLLMLDLDHFKKVNDTYGHTAGDIVLREVGAKLDAMVRSSDVAARFGGEEFALLLPHTSEEDAWLLADRIRQRIEAHNFEHENMKFKVTASIGVSSLSAGCLDRDTDLVLQADQALYSAKANGRNTVRAASTCVLKAVHNQ